MTRRAALVGLGTSGIAALTVRGGTGAQGATPAAEDQIEANKELVRRFYDAYYTGRRTGDTSLIDGFVAPDYIQHEAGVPQGLEGLKQLRREMHASSASAEQPVVVHLVGEGDLVVAYQVEPGPDPDGPPAREGFDLFRIANGQLAEHWGVYIRVSGASAGATPAS